jgi:hypothetical protein
MTGQTEQSKEQGRNFRCESADHNDREEAFDFSLINSFVAGRPMSASEAPIRLQALDTSPEMLNSGPPLA